MGLNVKVITAKQAREGVDEEVELVGRDDERWGEPEGVGRHGVDDEPGVAGQRDDRGGVVAVATRLPVGLADRGGWDGTRLDLPGAGDGARWHDVLTDRPVGDDLAGILATYPVALLVREG